MSNKSNVAVLLAEIEKYHAELEYWQQIANPGMVRMTAEKLESAQTDFNREMDIVLSRAFMRHHAPTNCRIRPTAPDALRMSPQQAELLSEMQNPDEL